MINWLPKYYKYFSKVLTPSLQKDLFLGNKCLIFILKLTKKKVKSFWEADMTRSLIGILNAHIHWLSKYASLIFQRSTQKLRHVAYNVLCAVDERSNNRQEFTGKKNRHTHAHARTHTHTQTSTMSVSSTLTMPKLDSLLFPTLIRLWIWTYMYLLNTNYMPAR